MNKQQEFMNVFAQYQQKSFELITTLFNNLNPNMPGEKAEQINNLFHSVCDRLEEVTELGKLAAKEMLQDEKKQLVPLAN